MTAVTIDQPGAMTTPASLPRAAAVVRAFDTIPAGGYRHPVLAAAAALAAEHRLRASVDRIVGDPPGRRSDGCCGREGVHARDTTCAVLIDRIDRWAATELAEGRAGVLHTESLGQIVNRMVTVWMRGQLLADARTAARDPQVRVASAQLGELGSAYDDLVTDLRLGRRRLPALQTPTGPPGIA
ncbi:DUF4254 domain-containing protein [Amycolatopsis sp. CA-128772]|uniref:DUF4254 domain-containing protein n=1 Tax=Amycolatopsis sp. CA-128772 TaxID=2073159 RepID=UPI0011B0096B|nr:DUF4254 domain-containing protein [Amycolatopsis sp. CA-128772]